MARQSRSLNNKSTVADVNNNSATNTNTNTSSSSTSTLHFGDLSKLTFKPPSLPIENDPRHIALLNRSLFQNDKEIVALEKLHESIRKVKSIILEHFGEEVLLDMVTLPDGGIASISEDKKEYHTTLRDEFVSRMKLRRKLLNRLARRLLRISHAMDGNIMGGSTLPNVATGKAAGVGIFPPALPKYGIDRNLPSEVWDLTTASYTSTPTEQIIEAKKTIKKYMDERTFKEETIQRIQLRKSKSVEESKDDTTPEAKLTEEEEKNELMEDNPISVPNTHAMREHNQLSSALSKTCNETRSDVSDIRNAILAFDPFKFNKDHQTALASIIEYDDEYDKIVNDADGSTKFAVTKEDFEEVIKTEESFLDSSKQPLGTYP